MSSDKRGFWGFFRRKKGENRPFVEFLEQEKMPEMKEEEKKISPEMEGQKSLDELFMDWDAGRASEKDLRSASRWDEKVTPEEARGAESIPPPETAEPPDLLVEFPPLLEGEELAQLLERRDRKKKPSPSAEAEPGTPGEEERRPSPPSQERAPTSEELREKQAISEAVEALREIGGLVVALEVRVAERLVEVRSDI